MLLYLFRDHSNKRHPLWPKTRLQLFHGYWNLAFLKVRDCRPITTCKTLRHQHKCIRHQYIYKVFQGETSHILRLEFENQGDIFLVKGIHSNRGSWMDRMRFWANQTWSSTLQSCLKQDFFSQRHISGDFYTRGKSRSALYWHLKSIMTLRPIFKWNSSTLGSPKSDLMSSKYSSKSTTHVGSGILS